MRSLQKGEKRLKRQEKIKKIKGKDKKIIKEIVQGNFTQLKDTSFHRALDVSSSVNKIKEQYMAHHVETRMQRT